MKEIEPMKANQILLCLLLATSLTWIGGSEAEARSQDKRKCEQKLVTAADRYVSCLLRARSARSAQRSSDVLEQKLNRCEGIYRPQVLAAVNDFGEEACTRTNAHDLAKYIEHATWQIHSASSIETRQSLPLAWTDGGTNSVPVESEFSMALWVEHPDKQPSLDEYTRYLISLSSFLEENPAITDVVIRIQDPELYGDSEMSTLNETLKDFPATVRLHAPTQKTGQVTQDEQPESTEGPIQYVSGSAFDATP